MSRFGKVTELILIVFVLTPMVAKSEVIQTWTTTSAVELTEPADLHHIVLLTHAFDGIYPYKTDPRLFTEVYLDYTDVGTMLSAVSGDDPDFEPYVSTLKCPECVVGICGVSTLGEGWCRGKKVGDLLDITMRQETIRRVSLRVDALEFDTSDPSKTVVRWTATLILDNVAEVPTERSTWGRIKSLYEQ